MKPIYSLVCISLLFLIQCKKQDCLESTGRTTSIKRPIAFFTQIHLYDNINLVITQGDEEEVMVEAGENLQPNISTRVENRILNIRNNTTCGLLRDPNEKINVFVTIKRLDSLFYDGSGNVTSSNVINTPDLKIFSKDGAGNIDLSVNTGVVYTQLDGANVDVTIHGKTSYLGAFVTSRATIDFSDLEANVLDMIYFSARDGKVNINGNLKIRMYHTGNVYYKGKPSIVDAEYYSSGRLLKVP